MTANGPQKNSQFGYKTHHNTEMMMIGVIDEVLRSFDNNQATIIVFFDLRAVFDTVNRDKLLQILHDEI